ncbi:CRISPR-associated endonuclease Cas1 [Breoghania sp.]|uniref:CRISPR-associated endonuclease Cas1 n=1 Tax=Breoghania sp. TaxID=2065378 RepID=UPI002AA83C1E|nr:CRISPR-associated endonuclease Cas1 [Breoghania sp.]
MPTQNRLPQRIDGATVFGDAASVAGLTAGWQRTWRNGGAAGGDGQTLQGFSLEIGKRLAVLSDELRSGAYRPRLLREVHIPKANGSEFRLLRIPAVRDRVVQSSLAQVLSPLLDKEFEDDSFAYRPGRGVRQALQRVQFLRRQGYVWTVDADIDDFFDRIPIDALLERVHRSITESPASELIALWLEHGASDGRGIPQGSPISPLLANLYLDDLDEAFSRKGLRIVRYADDFVLLARDKPAAEEALEEVGAFLSRHGLALNREKTRIRDYDASLKFLGQIFMRSWMLEDDKEAEQDLGNAQALLRKVADADRQEAQAAEEHAAAALQLARSGHDPGLRVLAIREPGRQLSLRNEGFSVIEAADETEADSPREIVSIHHTRIDRIEVGPRVATTHETLRHALACAIPVAFTDGHGETLGHLAPVLAPRAGRHLAQAKAMLAPEKRLDLARRVAQARLANQRALLRRVNHRRKLPAVATAAHGIGRTMRRLWVASTVEEIMGYEGLATSLYWRAFDRLLLNGFKLAGRSRRKKVDPINAALDLAVSLLHRDVSAVVVSRGLHPGFGALHTTSDARDACVYDLMEGFRAALPESLILSLTNTQMLQREMFAALPDGTIRMGAEAQRVIIRAYEARAATTIRYPRTDQTMTWRRVMHMEAEAYAAHVEERAVWEPFVLNY